MGPFTIGGRRLGWPAYVVAVALGVAVLVLRRPVVVTHPGLWAEDGPIFLRSAYLEPVYRSVFHSYNGYLHLLLRVWAEATTLLPASATAASYAVFSLLGTTLCYSTILSPRLREIIPSDGARAAAFAALVLFPATGEITGNLTNLLWPMAVALVLLSFASMPRTTRGRVGELAAVAVLGLTGATSLLVWPSFSLRWWRERTRHNFVVMALAYACAAVQGLILLTSHRAGSGLALKPRSVARAYTLRIFGNLTLGQHKLGHFIGKPVGVVLVVVCAVGIVATVAGWLALPAVARLQWLAVMVLTVGATTWSFNGDMVIMSQTNNAGRYFVLPCVLVAVAVIAAISRLPRPANPKAALLYPAAALFAFAAVGDFTFPHLSATHWDRSAACIRGNQVCHIKENPRSFSFDLPPVSHAR